MVTNIPDRETWQICFESLVLAVFFFCLHCGGGGGCLPWKIEGWSIGLLLPHFFSVKAWAVGTVLCIMDQSKAHQRRLSAGYRLHIWRLLNTKAVCLYVYIFSKCHCSLDLLSPQKGNNTILLVPFLFSTSLLEKWREVNKKFHATNDNDLTAPFFFISPLLPLSFKKNWQLHLKGKKSAEINCWGTLSDLGLDLNCKSKGGLVKFMRTLAERNKKRVQQYFSFEKIVVIRQKIGLS